MVDAGNVKKTINAASRSTLYNIMLIDAIIFGSHGIVNLI